MDADSGNYLPWNANHDKIFHSFQVQWVRSICNNYVRYESGQPVPFLLLHFKAVLYLQRAQP